MATTSIACAKITSTKNEAEEEQIGDIKIYHNKAALERSFKKRSILTWLQYPPSLFVIPGFAPVVKARTAQ